MIDTHCHLNDPRFAEDAEATVLRSRAAGVTALLVAGYDQDSCERALELAGLPGVWVALGIHPHDASSIEDRPDWLDALEQSLVSCDRVAALGEIGLDSHYMHSPREIQEEAFRQQLRLADRLALPMTIHSRAAEDRVLDILGEEAPPSHGAVLHAFTGTSEQAVRALEIGCHIGCTGMVTFRKGDALRDMLRQVPLDRLLLETDCPYLAPDPLRGRRNEPANLAHIRDAVASLLGCSPEEVERQTTQNALTVLRRMKGDTADG